MNIPDYLLWLGLVIVFGIVEAATMGLTSIWFAVGALAAMASAVCHAPLWLQIAVFVVISGAAVWFTRGKVQKQFNRGREATNADRIIGHVGVVQEAIDNREAVCLVKVDGTLWTARSLTDQPIPAGAEVVIRSIEGVKVLVTPAE